MYSSAFVWAKILNYLEERLSAITVSAWFDDADVVELNEEHLILYTASDFRRDIIRKRCTDLIQDALKEIFNSDEFKYYGSGVVNEFEINYGWAMLENFDSKESALNAAKLMSKCEKNYLTAHILLNSKLSESNIKKLKYDIKEYLYELNIAHCTLEIEYFDEKCDSINC